MQTLSRGGSRNSLRGGGGGSGPEFFEGGFRVQVRGNFHILTSKKNKKTTSEGGGVKPPNPPPPSGSATDSGIFERGGHLILRSTSKTANDPMITVE